MTEDVTQIRQWIHPRQAVGLVIAALNISREDAIGGIVARLISGKITAISEDYVGPSDEGNCLNQSCRPMILWKGLWLNSVMRSPSSSIWITGDLEASLGDDSLVFINIRFNAPDIDNALRNWLGSEMTAHTQSASVLPPGVARLAMPVSSKWDWEAALIALIAVANHPDGLSSIPGFDPPKHGSQARLEAWFEAYFSQAHGGDGPSETERRKRAQAVMRIIREV